MYNYCDCGDVAVWMYAPGHGEDFNDFYCEKCVPRGCSCQLEPVDGDYDNLNSDNWVNAVDELGRLLPCVEFFYIGDTDES